MTFLNAVEYAEKAAGHADATANLGNNNESNPAFESLSLAVFELNKAVPNWPEQATGLAR
jgi:hypothetical protein